MEDVGQEEMNVATTVDIFTPLDSISKFGYFSA